MHSHPLPYRFLVNLTMATLIFAVVAARSAQASKFVGLGDLPGGSFESKAFAISADGSVVVGFGASTSGGEAFRWTRGGGMVGLGDLVGGIVESFAYGVSADGSVVVGRAFSASGYEAFRWTSSGGMVGLGDLPFGLSSSRASGVSADGSVVVGQSVSNSGFEAFRWTSGGGIVGLGDLAGGTFSSGAYGVTADGSIIVGGGSSFSGAQAFRWTSTGGIVGLGDLAGGLSQSSASAVSNDGSVVIGFGASAASDQEAFRWTSAGGMVGLGDLAGGLFQSSALGVSADGSVVVGFGYSATVPEAFIWDAANGMRSVKDVISPSIGAALNGWRLHSANAVSADGRTIVGEGTDPSGNQQAWLAYLPDNVFWSPKSSGDWDAAANWSGPFAPTTADGRVIDPAGSLTVTGPSASSTVKSLTIGGGTGIATLELQSGGTITSSTVVIDNTGVLTGDGTIAGNVVSQGTVRADNVTITGTLINLQDGTVEGDGRINASLNNGSAGLVRARAGERLRIIGTSHTNNGRIEAIGTSSEPAEIEFGGTLTNAASTGLITGRNAIVRFGGGLANNGNMALSFGTSDVFGDIKNDPGARITVTGGSNATFYDDLINNGIVQTSAGSTAVFFGDVSGTGSFPGTGTVYMEGDMAPGSSPAKVEFGGNVVLGPASQMVMELAGTVVGSKYDQLDVAGTLSLAGTLDVKLLDGFAPSYGQSFDLFDFDALAGSFDSVHLPTLGAGLEWNTSELYTTGAIAIVPEPATIGLLAIGVATLFGFRIRARLKGRLVSTTVSLVIAITVTRGAYGQGTTETIALTGQTVPDGSGQFEAFDINNFAFPFSSPRINATGQAAFSAVLRNTSGGANDNTGIFRGNGVSLTQIARAGQTAPDGNGQIDNVGNFLALNSSGQIAFTAGLRNTALGDNDNSAIFRGNGGTLTQIARAGQSAPDGNGLLNSFFYPVLNMGGQVAFSAGLRNTVGGFNDSQAIFRGSGGILTQIVRTAQPAPDGNGQFRDLLSYELNGGGQIALSGILSNTSGGFNDFKGIFRGSGGALTQIARAGRTAPDDNGQLNSFSVIALNSAGQAAFSAGLVNTRAGFDDDRAIFRGAGGALTQIARSGQPVPDGNGQFNDFIAPVLSADGQAAFVARLRNTIGGAPDDFGIFRGSDSGTLTQIARGGQTAPDGNGQLWPGFSSILLNNGGQVAFSSAVLNSSGGEDDSFGIFLGDGREQITVVRRGQVLNGGTVRFFDFRSGSEESGFSALNDFGQLAYTVAFTNNNAGVFVFTPKVRYRNSAGGSWDDLHNWTLSLVPGAPHEVRIDPAGSLTVTGPSGRATVKSLTVGGRTGIATLRLQSGGSIRAADGLTILSTGVLTGDGSIDGGAVNFGTIAADNVTIQGGLSNKGLIKGSGRVAFDLTNATTGRVRIAGGEHLLIDGMAHSNDGSIRVSPGGELEVSGTLANRATIDVIGGTAEFTGAVTNASTGAINGRDSTLSFPGKLTNAGAVSFSFGTMDVFGNIKNDPGGRITVSGESRATFYGSLANNGGVQVSAGSTAVFFGTFSGAGVAGTGTVYIEGGLSPGNSPAEAMFGGNLVLGPDSRTLMELAGTIVGSGHDQLDVAGKLTLAGALDVTLLDGFTPAYGQSFDLLDFAALSGQFGSVDLPALSAGLTWSTADLYTTGTITAVPEPTSIALTVAGLALLGVVVALRRHRSVGIDRAPSFSEFVGGDRCAQ